MIDLTLKVVSSGPPMNVARYSSECAAGRAVAASVIERLRAGDSPLILRKAVAALPDARSPAAIGFWQEVAEALAAAPA